MEFTVTTEGMAVEELPLGRLLRIERTGRVFSSGAEEVKLTAATRGILYDYLTEHWGGSEEADFLVGRVPRSPWTLAK